MTRFRTRFQRVAVPNLLRQFGEEIGYFNAAGDPVRTITAMVQRDGSELLAEAGDVSVEMFIVRVDNNATTGISSAEIDTGGDEVTIAPRVGETPRRMSIVSMFPGEPGMTRFVVQ